MLPTTLVYGTPDICSFSFLISGDKAEDNLKSATSEILNGFVVLHTKTFKYLLKILFFVISISYQRFDLYVHPNIKSYWMHLNPLSQTYHSIDLSNC
jgi:hypothetical protein